MEPAKGTIKMHNCKHHPNEVTQRVCTELGCDYTLCCIECIISGHGSCHAESLLTMAKFIDKAAKHYETLRRIKSDEDSPPIEFTDFLSKEDENLAKLSQHIENQKIIADQAISNLLNSFSELCDCIKKSIHLRLDSQLSILRANYLYYKTKLNDFYSKKEEDLINPTKSDLISKFNRAEQVEDYENLIKSIKDDLSDQKLFEGSLDSKIQIMKLRIKDMATNLKIQEAEKPILAFNEKGSIIPLLDRFKDFLNPFFEENFAISNSKYEFTLNSTSFLDSKIVKTYEESRMICKWISDGTARLKLLYRGSRDTFSSSAFHKKVSNNKPTITLVKSKKGKIFGGFTDQNWEVALNYKQSENTFIFSVTEKKKLTLKENMSTYSTYAYSNYLPTFGGGHDFYLAENCNDNSSSYCNLGHSYETEGLSKEDFAGGYNFSVSELEVFLVEYSGRLLTKKKKKQKQKNSQNLENSFEAELDM